MSETEHAGPHKDAGVKEQGASDLITAFVCASALVPVSVRALARVSDLFPGTPRQGL